MKNFIFIVFKNRAVTYFYYKESNLNFSKIILLYIYKIKINDMDTLLSIIIDISIVLTVYCTVFYGWFKFFEDFYKSKKQNNKYENH